MIINSFPQPINALILYQTYNDFQLQNISEEVTSLYTNNDGAIWLSDAYSDVEESFIHRTLSETFFTNDIQEALFDINNAYGLYSHVNNHATEIKHYGHKQSTFMQFDAAAFTIKTFLFEDPKDFSGGNVTLQAGGHVAYEQDIQNNMSIIFPSSYYFALSEVNTDDPSNQKGLYVITSYLFIESH